MDLSTLAQNSPSLSAIMKALASSIALFAPGTSNVFASPGNDNNTLVPFAYKPLSLGSITATGWLRDQLQLMSDGLAGHEADFYRYVADSSWIGGGSEYSDLNEGFPYWYNGLVHLAYGLNDDRLKEQVHNATQIVLDRQQSDGWIGPETGTWRTFWGRYPLFLGMTGLAEANSSWTQPVVDHLHTFMQLMNNMMADDYAGYIYHDGDHVQEGDYQWGQVRSQDMMITLQWLYENYPANRSDLLLQNMKSLHDKGLNWEDFYNEGAYFGQGMDGNIADLPPDVADANFPYEHGVNVGQGLKAVAVVRRWNGNDSLIQTAMDGVNWTMTYHGAASGTILADERLEGLAPYSGSELCTSVETIYSLAYLYQALGVNYYADRAELAAFNSLPAMLTPDWWAHQYVQQPNQPNAANLSKTPFWNTNSVSTTFGLEPDYPCCTVNHPAGWPKFLSNSYVQVGQTGLAHVLLSPGTVKSTLNSNQNAVTVSCQTAYPFYNTLTYTIEAKQPFDFYVRVPEWATSGSNVKLGDAQSMSLSPDIQSGLHKISVPAGQSVVTYNLESEITTSKREADTVAVYKGALLYALEVSNFNTSAAPQPYGNPSSSYPDGYAPPQSEDWQYFNSSAWNYAIDPSTFVYKGPGSGYGQLANPIFGPRAPPNYIEVQGCQIDWPLYLGSVPDYPPTGDARKCVTKKETLRLVPYASAKTHMTDLPTISLT